MPVRPLPDRDDSTKSSSDDVGGDPGRTDEEINLKFFIEVFSGTGGLSGAVKAGAVLTYAVDIEIARKATSSTRTRIGLFVI